MRKKENIRYDVHHPGSDFPLRHPFLVLHLVIFVIYSFIIDLPHDFLAPVQFSRYHTPVIVHDDLQHG